MIMEFREMNIDSLIIKLTEEYPTEQDKVRNIKMLIGEIEKENYVQNNIESLQQICNDLYNISSTESLIELQVIINEYRNKYDVTDPREVINWDNGKGFVQ